MMAAPLEAPPSGSGADSNEGVEVCLFEESADGFSRTVRAIAELTAGKPELDFPESEVERIASSVTFLREWRYFSYDPKGVGFTDDSETPSSRNDVHSITLPQFSSASVPQITKQEDQKDTTDSFDFILFAGGNVWALDWCPRFSNKPASSINCEYLSVAAHPPGSSYHKLGLPLTGRGIIQVWCLLAPFEDAHSCQSLNASNTSSRRGRPRKMPDGNNSSVSNSSNPPKPRGRPRKIPDGSNPVGSSPNPPKPRGRPRKIPDGSNTVGSSPNPPKPRGRPRKRPIDLSEPVPKRPRGRPRKNPLPVDIVEDSGREVIKVNKKDIGNDTPHCNTENGQAHVAPICQSDGIEGVESAEFVRIEQSREDGNKLSYIENSKSSPIPKDVALPRVVLCLAHNGKVAWDIKWKPLIPSQPEQESCLGFLAVLLGNGSLEVWEVPSPHMIQKIYSPSKVEGSDPRFLKLQPVFRCAKVKCGNRQSIPLTVDWSPSPPHDMILAGCHDGMVALWKFSTNFSSQDSKPVMCVTADSVPIRSLSWAPYISGENINTFVTAGEDGLKFWDLRDPYRPLWELTTAPRAVLSLHWLKDARGIVISLEDGTLKFLSLPRIANDVPVTGRPFIGSKTQGVSTYQLSEYLIWSVHASEITGYAAYCGADGTAVHFQLTSRYWEKEPGRNRAPYFLCGSLSEEGGNIKIGSNSGKFPLSNVPLGAKKGPKSFQDVVQVQDVGKIKLNNTPDSGDFLPLTVSCENSEFGDDCQEDTHDEEQGAGAIVLAGPMEQENNGILNTKACESPKDFEVFPPKSVALHRVRWNTNKGSERWLCYGGAAGIVRCQRI